MFIAKDKLYYANGRKKKKEKNRRAKGWYSHTADGKSAYWTGDLTIQNGSKLYSIYNYNDRGYVVYSVDAWILIPKMKLKSRTHAIIVLRKISKAVGIISSSPIPKMLQHTEREKGPGRHTHSLSLTHLFIFILKFISDLYFQCQMTLNLIEVERK